MSNNRKRTRGRKIQIVKLANGKTKTINHNSCATRSRCLISQL